jgi:COP9 signalosome complex subunit 1
MDVDEDTTIQQSTSSQPQPRTRIIAPVDDAHPFDLEGYISNYTGSTPLIFPSSQH